MPSGKKKFSNLPQDWRLEPPPPGDWRFLGHPSHDARGFLRKHSQFEPWVLHCMCGKVHNLPAAPKLDVGLPVMVHAIDLASPHAELNGLGGKIMGAPDSRRCYPVKLNRTGEIVLLHQNMLKTQLFTQLGTLYQDDKVFNSKATRDEDGRVVLPPVAPKPPPPPPKPKRVSLGLFLRNFSQFVKDGLKVQKYGSHGPVCEWYPQTGVPRLPYLLWMDSNMSHLLLGTHKKDPYQDKWPLSYISEIVSWNDGDTNTSFGRGDTNKGWSTDGGSLPSLDGTNSLASPMPGSVNSTDANNYNHYGGGGLAFTQEYSKPSSTTAATAAAAAEEDGQPLLSHSSPQPTPSLKSPSATSRSSRRRGSEDVNSLRRDLTLVIVKEQVDEESWAQQLDPVLPTYVHLRFTSTKVRLYVATCLAKLTNLKITSAEAPAERGKGAMERIEPPPLGKPADHRKLLIALREFVTKTKVNWSPYVAIRRFVRIGCDDEGYVTRLMLSEAGLQLDLADFGLLLGRKLVELNCYYSDQLTGVLNLIGGCPALEKLNLGNCTKVEGDIEVFSQFKEDAPLMFIDLHWCSQIVGNISAFLRCHNLRHLNLSGLPLLNGKLESLMQMPLLEHLSLTGPNFQGDIGVVLAQFPRLKVASFEQCSDIVGDIQVMAHLPHLEELRLSGCKRITGDVKVFRVGPPISDADGFYDSGNHHFDRGQGSALHAMGSAVEGDANSGSIISVEKSLAPMSFTALLELNKEQEVDNYGIFDNRHHGRGRDPRPLAHLTEVSLHECFKVKGDAAVFASLPLLKKCVLWKTSCTLSEEYGASKDALKRILPPDCSILI